MKICVTAWAAAVMAACTASLAFAQDLGGRYNVIGTNFNGSSYSGTVEITVTSKNTCRIVWMTGGSTSSGICMRNGNAFAAAYALGDKIGLVIYDSKPDGSLDGLWTIADQSGVGTERLVPIR